MKEDIAAGSVLGIGEAIYNHYHFCVLGRGANTMAFTGSAIALLFAKTLEFLHREYGRNQITLEFARYGHLEKSTLSARFVSS